MSDQKTKAERAHQLKTKAAEREQRRQTVAANMLAGLNYRSIADGLGVSLGTVAADVKIIMGRWRKEQLEAISEIVRLELTRLDRALFGIWSDVQEGNTRAIATMLKIMERRAKLLGLDAPSDVKIDWQEKLPEGLDPAAVKKRLAALLAASIRQDQPSEGGEGES